MFRFVRLRAPHLLIYGNFARGSFIRDLEVKTPDSQMAAIPHARRLRYAAMPQNGRLKSADRGTKTALRSSSPTTFAIPY